MKILIAFCNELITNAVKELMNKSKGKYQIESRCTAKGAYSEDSWKNYEVIVTDYPTLSRIPRDCFNSSRILIMDNGLEKETVVSLFLTEKITGLIAADADLDSLLKAIQVVRKGELWIDNSTVKSVLNRTMSRKVKDIAKLTEREMAIIKLVREGYRNKQIADVLAISEQTVKSHLNRIFRKTNVSARTELIAHFASGFQK